jgi:hypothetical protein
MILRKEAKKEKREQRGEAGGKDCPLFQTSEPPELSEWFTAGQGLPCYVLFTAFSTRLTSHVARQQNQVDTERPVNYTSPIIASESIDGFS